MNTTSPPFLSHKLTIKHTKMVKQTNSDMAEHSPELYDEILKYYENQNVYFPL